MEIFLTLVAVLVFSLTTFFAKSGKPKESPPTFLPTPTVSFGTTAPSLKPMRTSTMQTLPQTSNRQEIDDFIYPGSKIISSGDGSLVLTSSDDPNLILSWYSQKFLHGFSSNRATNNNVNGQVNAKIEASNGSKIFTITLTKNNSELYTRIEISIKSQ